MDEDEIAFREKQKAGMGLIQHEYRPMWEGRLISSIDAKANKEMAEKAKGKGPMNAGQQGIKKSGKK